MDDYAGLEILIQRVRNWARWCKESTPKGHCRSIEHRYRSPQWGHWDSTPPAIPSPIDVLDAHRVEDAMHSLHWRQRLIIKLTYIKRWQEGWICSKLAINRKDFQDARYFSLLALESSLNPHSRGRNLKRHNSESEPPLLFAA